MSLEADVARALAAGGAAPELIERLAAYGALVLDVNRTTNLTAARDPESFAAQILDALTLAQDVRGELIDIGSGAGLPGIPLAIASGRRVTLVDSVKKKAAFLRTAIERLGLEGEAVDSRAESLGRDSLYRERYGSATARAVSTAPTVAELTLPFLAVGGRALLQRGVMEAGEREALTDAARMLGGELIEERLLGGDRRLLVIVKAVPTQARFPRREGIPEKRPLCA
ncbi:MAG: 16S rRNA (guanine(527)-N(7))-methyltransferase RsmG [Candidatus Velthaea sp.]